MIAAASLTLSDPHHTTQGQAERREQAERMVAQIDAEGFGACSFTGACAAACQVSVSLESITRMNQEYLSAKLS